MSNQYFTNPVVLDTFTSAIDLCASSNYLTGTPFKVISIEWQTPTNTSHTALITDAASGNVIFSEKCTVENQSIIKYFNQWLSNIYIAASGVGSGSIVITLE